VIGHNIIEAFKYVWTFWNAMFHWVQSIQFPGWLSFLYLDSEGISRGHFIALVVGYIAVYLAVCVVVAKLCYKPMKALDRHMRNHGAYVTYNGVLYLIIIGLLLLDYVWFTQPGFVEELGFSFGPLTTVAGLVFIFAVIRMLLI
jgi:hypothetical protein